MAGIEFVDDHQAVVTGRRGPDGSDLLLEPPPRRPALPLRTWLPAAVGLAAVICTVVAPWRLVFQLTGAGSDSSPTAVDGWGRYNAVGSNEHGTRYGILLCVAAGLLLAGVALRFLGMLYRRRAVTTCGTGLLIGGMGVVGGGVGAMALETANLSDRLADARRASRFGQGPVFDEGVRNGGAVWLGIAAVVVGLVALTLPLVWREREIPLPAPGTLPPPAPVRPASHYVPHPDDETLDG